MPGLSHELLARCTNTFLKCHEFDDDSLLRALFATVDLYPFKDRLEDAQSKDDRVSKCIFYLIDPRQYTFQKEVALVPFLATLVRKYEGHPLQSELDSLYKDAKKELEEQSEKKQETQDLKAAQANFLSSSQAETIHSSAQQWFEESSSDAERTFRIALAAFNGAYRKHIIDAADDLNNRISSANIDRPSSTTPVSKVPSLFDRESLSKRLKRAHAQDVIRIDAYSNSINVIELDHPAYSQALLRYLWEEYPEIQKVLIEWLTIYATASTADMRNRAAVAVGTLAIISFTEISQGVLEPWALKGDRIYRAAVANALDTTVQEKTHEAQVLDLLDSWTTDNDIELKWAAGRAYARVGLHFPERAFQAWKKIIDSESAVADVTITETLHLSIPNPLHVSIADSLISLMFTAVETIERFQPVFEAALTALQNWSRGDNNSPSKYFALSLFVVLTTIPRDPQNGEGESKTSNHYIPAMLTLIDPLLEKSDYRKCLVELFSGALMSPSVGDQASYALESWFKLADEKPQYQQHLRILLRDMLSSDRDNKHRLKDRIEWRLKNWATRRPDALKSAQTIREQLSW